MKEWTMDVDYRIAIRLARALQLLSSISSSFSSKLYHNGKLSKENWLSANDPLSFSNPEKNHVKHMDLKWNLDFTRKVISGSVEYEVVVENTEESILILDTKELFIQSVNSLNGDPLPFELGEVVHDFGQPLKINISSLHKKSAQNDKFKIAYETAPESYGLKWLDKEETKGMKHPYVFSACQPIFCRTILPCQDTPGAKATYTAEVTVPNPLQALMSALVVNNSLATTNKGLRTFRFIQKIPIPAYLIAIAVGNIVGKQVSPRVTIWSEPELLDAAVYEFMETEKYLKSAEKAFGEYVWGVYDILVTPPNLYPAAMENPCLTFASSILLAGDRTMSYYIYHEIAHSWFGNLVTNKNYEHTWLNEGLATFAERKIWGLIDGEDYRQLVSVNGLKDLKDTIDNLGPDNEFTKLVPDMTLGYADRIFTDIPYEKGYVFVYYLEEKLGGADSILPFLREYISKYQFKSIDSNDFKAALINYFTNVGKSKEVEEIDWNAWLYSPGMPPVIPRYHTKLFDAPRKLAGEWISWNGEGEPSLGKLDYENLSPVQKVEFLNTLISEPQGLSIDKLQTMQSVYHLNSRINHDIKYRWLRLGIISKWIDQVNPALQFVTEQAHSKSIRQLYRDLYNWEGTVREKTIEHFQKNRHKMFAKASTDISRILNLIHQQVKLR